MGQGDLMPAGRRRKKAIDPKKLKKIREGWEKADKIREKAHVHHEEYNDPSSAVNTAIAWDNPGNYNNGTPVPDTSHEDWAASASNLDIHPRDRYTHPSLHHK